MIYNKYLGQNFLIDKKIISVFVNNINSDNTSNLLEIGPGNGYLTYPVIKYSKYSTLSIYELDAHYYEHIKRSTPQRENIIIFNEDILNADLNGINDLYVYGAIPYSITSPLLHKLFSLDPRPVEILLIVQKEFADKLFAETPKANYWTFISYHFNKYKITDVDPTSFNPQPKVESSVIKLTLNLEKDKIIHTIGLTKWKGFLRLIFNNKNRMLKSAFDPKILTKCNIDPNKRAHDLSFDDLLSLYSVLKS